MSKLKMVAVAAVSAALLVGAPAVAQGAAPLWGDQALLGGQGYGDRDRDRDWRDGDRDRDWDRGWNGGGISVRGLQGLRVDSAKDALRRSGYSYVRAVRDNGRHYDLWWNGRSCLGFTSYNGRVTEAHEFRGAQCGDISGRGGRIQPRELEGLRVDVAKDALRRAGLSYSHSIRVGGRQFDLWSGYGRRDQCVGFSSYNGRVTEARQFAEREC